MNCTLANLSMKDWHELVSKLLNGEQIGHICDIMLLRLAIILIKTFRNFMSHLTTEICLEIDSGIITDPKIPPFCRSWINIQDLFEFAIDQVLRYLRKEDEDFSHMKLESQREFMRNVATAPEYTNLDIYEEKISKFSQLEKFSFNAIERKLASIMSIKVKVEFLFDEPTEFDLENSEELNDIFKNAIESHLGEGVTAKLTGRETQDSSNSTFFPLTFKVNSAETDLKDYANYFNPNQKPKELWKILKAVLYKELPIVKEISLQSWDEGSIIISVAINKESNKDWSEDEMDEIEKTMTRFAEEFKFTGDLSHLTMTFKSKRDTFKKELPTSQRLIYRLNAFSEEMAAKFDKIDEEKLQDCLQVEMSNVKEKVKVTGMKRLYLIKTVFTMFKIFFKCFIIIPNVKIKY